MGSFSNQITLPKSGSIMVVFDMALSTMRSKTIALTGKNHPSNPKALTNNQGFFRIRSHSKGPRLPVSRMVLNQAQVCTCIRLIGIGEITWIKAFCL